MRAVIRPKRRPHPLLFAMSAVLWGATVYLNRSVTCQTLLFVVLLASMTVTTDTKTTWRYLLWSLPLMVVYTVVGSLFGPAGGHVLWRGPHVPGLGWVTLTTDSLREGMYRALRLWNLLGSLFVLFRHIQSDDIVYWLGRRFSRIGLTLSMILGFVPGLLTERRRIVENVQLRGALSGQSSRRVCMRAQATVYQTLLMNALERSWRLAESMYVRGYGSQSRRLYARPAWTHQDLRLMTCCGIALGWNVWTGLAGQEATWMWMGQTSADGLAIAMTSLCWIWMGVRVRA